ncbi:DUF4129 domain-containing protein [Halorientalis salina]|uniref:DUF4129 domain-containing protein n=1 Tax=Halorientalis salina TaxID=2932266 RepID=UPI00145DF656|nr:DUF4129 domain-containing protein [Halorientalis salina]
MRFRRVLSVLLVAGCLFAFTSLAGSLDSSISGTPDDLIDVDSGLLPIDSGQVSDVSDSLNEAEQSSENSDSSSASSQDAPPTEDGSAAAKTPGSGDETVTADAEPQGGAKGQSDDGGSDSSMQQDDGPGDKEGFGPAERGQTLLERLLQVLEQLLPVFVGLLLLGAVALLLHYRDRIWSAIVRYLGPYIPWGGETTGSNSPLSRPPANGIERAWLDMVRSADVDVDSSATPREYASAAVSGGLHQDPVWELTDLFERVRYGRGEITPKDVTHAERCLRESSGRSEGGLDG